MTIKRRVVEQRRGDYFSPGRTTKHELTITVTIRKARTREWETPDAVFSLEYQGQCATSAPFVRFSRRPRFVAARKVQSRERGNAYFLRIISSNRDFVVTETALGDNIGRVRNRVSSNEKTNCLNPRIIRCRYYCELLHSLEIKNKCILFTEKDILTRKILWKLVMSDIRRKLEPKLRNFKFERDR